MGIKYMTLKFTLLFWIFRHTFHRNQQAKKKIQVWAVVMEFASLSKTPNSESSASTQKILLSMSECGKPSTDPSITKLRFVERVILDSIIKNFAMLRGLRM